MLDELALEPQCVTVAGKSRHHAPSAGLAPVLVVEVGAATDIHGSVRFVVHEADHGHNVEEAEELAAVAPSLAPDSGCWHGSVQTEDGIKAVTVCPVLTELGRLYLCAVGDSSATVDTELIRGGHGVRRILN